MKVNRSAPKTPRRGYADFEFLRTRPLRQPPLHRMPVHVRQPPLGPVVVVRQLLVIDSKEVQHRGVKVWPRDGLICHLPTDFIRGTIYRPRLEPASGAPKGKAVA